MAIHDAQSIFFTGIGGVGMSGLARLLAADGKRISGSDITTNELVERLEKAKITVIVGTQDGTAIPDECDLLIYTGAVPDDHPELVAAGERNIPTLTYFQAVGEYMSEYETTIAISGTHGKSTTTTMIAEVLVKAGLDPTVLVGTIVPSLDSNARVGSKKLFVVEACEHKEHMLNLHPNMIVLTNIEEDHLDHYRDLEHIVMTFQKYVNHLPSDGILIKNVDDSDVEELGYDGTVVRYGIEEEADLRAVDMHVGDGRQRFSVGDQKFALQVPGKFNVYNALAAIAVAKQLGVADEITTEALNEFKGVWRRFEHVGTHNKAILVTDYAHHPTAIHSTIKAAREFYPKHRVIVAFQPHLRSRTQQLFDGFVSSLGEADFVIVQEIYDVVGREGSEDISSTDLVSAISKAGRYAQYTSDAEATKAAITETVEEGDVVLIMGAGDMYKIAEELKQ